MAIVNAHWDPDAGVWVATSPDVPGLATESTDRDALTAKVQVMVEDLVGGGVQTRINWDPA